MIELESLMAEYLIYWFVMLLFVVGIYGMLFKRNILKKIMAMNIMQISVIIFFLVIAHKTDATVPILIPGITEAKYYVNPLPHALMLTAIVVSLGTLGVALALTLKIQRKFKSLEEPDILREMKK